jgi:hypothetical protein
MGRGHLGLPHAARDGRVRKSGISPDRLPGVVLYHRAGVFDDFRLNLDPLGNLKIFVLAVHEWIGLAAYWVSGRIDRLFPGPNERGLTRRVGSFDLPSPFN